MKWEETSPKATSRRETLRILGAAGVGALAAACGAEEGASAMTGGNGVPSCVVRPSQTEGPYFVDERLNRADIRSDPTDGSLSQGVVLRLTFNVSRIAGSSCAPLVGALVDVWHCDALGVYSDVADSNGLFDTTGKKYLRGYQLTSDSGVAGFTTIFPGWYFGRTVHIHFKIRTVPVSGPGYEFTSQLYFGEDITDAVHAQAPYSSKGRRSTTNAMDGIFQQGGSQLLLQLSQDAQGYAASFDIGLQIS